MILSIYRSRLFRHLVYFFIGLILSGCSGEYLIKDYGSPDINVPSVIKVYLDDGRRIDFDDKANMNKLLKIDKDELTYKNNKDNLFTISTRQIARLYEERFSPLNSFFCVLGILALLFIGLIIWFALSFHGHSFAG